MSRHVRLLASVALGSALVMVLFPLGVSAETSPQSWIEAKARSESEDISVQCSTQVRSVGSLGIDWGNTCTVSRTSYAISRLTLGNQRWINGIPWVPQFGQHCGAADGRFGPVTEGCVRSFQRGVAGLADTGTINAATWRALENQRQLMGCSFGACDYKTPSSPVAIAQRRDSYAGVTGPWFIRNLGGTAWRWWNSSSILD